MVSPNPGGYFLNVADAGLVDLGANLAKACHVAIYGVLFDFNKSTLRRLPMRRCNRRRI
jgi:hypothetical protein